MIPEGNPRKKKLKDCTVAWFWQSPRNVQETCLRWCSSPVAMHAHCASFALQVFVARLISPRKLEALAMSYFLIKSIDYIHYSCCNPPFYWQLHECKLPQEKLCCGRLHRSLLRLYRPQSAVSCSTLWERAAWSSPNTSQVSLGSLGLPLCTFIGMMDTVVLHMTEWLHGHLKP